MVADVSICIVFAIEQTAIGEARGKVELVSSFIRCALNTFIGIGALFSHFKRTVRFVVTLRNRQNLKNLISSHGPRSNLHEHDYTDNLIYAAHIDKPCKTLT